MDREQKNIVQRDLKKEMVFLAGSRQMGRSWLVKEIAKDYQNPLYPNYDHHEDMEIVQQKT